MRRCYFEGPLAGRDAGAVLPLSIAESHHLRNVLRGSVGDVVEVFDGRNWRAQAEIARLERSGVQLRLCAEPEQLPTRRPCLWLAVAPPKQDRLRWLVEKGVELGVDRVTLLNTERSVVEPGAGKLERLREAAIQACKQCGRCDLPTLEAPCSLATFLQAWRTNPTSTTRLLLVADRQGAPLMQQATEWQAAAPDVAAVVIGPEGGLTAGELAEVRQAGGRTVRLGEAVLRIETAALAAAALLRGVWSTDGGEESAASQH